MYYARLLPRVPRCLAIYRTSLYVELNELNANFYHTNSTYIRQYALVVHPTAYLLEHRNRTIRSRFVSCTPLGRLEEFSHTQLTVLVPGENSLSSWERVRASTYLSKFHERITRNVPNLISTPQSASPLVLARMKTQRRTGTSETRGQSTVYFSVQSHSHVHPLPLSLSFFLIRAFYGYVLVCISPLGHPRESSLPRHFHDVSPPYQRIDNPSSLNLLKDLSTDLSRLLLKPVLIRVTGPVRCPTPT